MQTKGGVTDATDISQDTSSSGMCTWEMDESGTGILFKQTPEQDTTAKVDGP